MQEFIQPHPGHDRDQFQQRKPPASTLAPEIGRQGFQRRAARAAVKGRMKGGFGLAFGDHRQDAGVAVQAAE